MIEDSTTTKHISKEQMIKIQNETKVMASEEEIPKSRQLEQRLEALAALRAATRSSSKKEKEESLIVLPPNYYPRINKQSYRDEL
eukprot:CAMPEP_0194152240 /NCGR_PEP_ID=MMETSP0152-20130528/51522_1 /TAXON_ID=1049557 /ORGANISM="Thalassiothrix antarctica, Strain L6-D1" /LENGTH=84 /DNA_ID=CAMNT_0038856619 /DNA_START=1 /DNA_END=252 /DNA_ORIENTATION=+